MAVTSLVSLNIEYSGNMQGTQIIPTAENTSGAGKIDIKSLVIGANTITPPTGGTVPQGVIIVPPSGNTVSITLKGVTGDTGIRLHNTEPSYIPIDPSVASFILTAGAAITGVRLFWN